MEKIGYQLKDNNLEIFLKGRIDSSNASQFEEMLNEITEGKENCHVIFDATHLEYLSSAGLRVVLKMIKKLKDMEIVNVNMDVYEIFDMTGFTELTKIRKAFRRFDVTGCKVIGEGAKGIVYRYNNDTIIKVYKNNDVLSLIQKERELAKKAFILGIPTAISYDVVLVGDKYGSVFELLDCDSMSNAICNNPENLKSYAKIFSDLSKLIHSTYVSDISDMNDIMNTLYKWLNNAKQYLANSYDKIKDMIDNIPKTQNMVHGDFHTNNIMMQKDEVLLIDMDTLAYGNRIEELAVIDFAYSSMNDVCENNSLDFLGIDKKTAKEFYNEFIKNYFEGLDNDKLQRNLNKIRLLAYLRIANHISRGKADLSKVDMVVNEINRLLGIIDNLILE